TSARSASPTVGPTWRWRPGALGGTTAPGGRHLFWRHMASRPTRTARATIACCGISDRELIPRPGELGAAAAGGHGGPCVPGPHGDVDDLDAAGEPGRKAKRRLAGAELPGLRGQMAAVVIEELDGRGHRRAGVDLDLAGALVVEADIGCGRRGDGVARR